MIDKNKKYRTRNGKNVVIYATDGYGDHPIHGAVGGEIMTWDKNGKYSRYNAIESINDLIEVNPNQELLDKAHRDYPKGTMVRGLFTHLIWECSGSYYVTNTGNLLDIVERKLIYIDDKDKNGWAKRVKAVTTVKYIDID